MASKLETQIERILSFLVEYKDQVDLSKITNCKIHSGIRVDFWIPSIRTVIEAHGIQHYQESGFGQAADETRNKFIKQKNRDEKLRGICNQFNVRLIEVPYNEFNSEAFTKELLELL